MPQTMRMSVAVPDTEFSEPGSRNFAVFVAWNRTRAIRPRRNAIANAGMISWGPSSPTMLGHTDVIQETTPCAAAAIIATTPTWKASDSTEAAEKVCRPMTGRSSTWFSTPVRSSSGMEVRPANSCAWPRCAPILAWMMPPTTPTIMPTVAEV
ncbi:hypothetical protein L597_002900000120 [Micrococcus luteus J28]|nr:hypothetical protein L597_002900000120 [Micrococcus luteus J28]